MKTLTEIVRILTKKRLKKIETLNDITIGKKENLYYQLYKGIKTGKLRNDQEAAKALYDSTPDDIRYQKLKSRFRQRLLNNLFFLDNESTNESEYHKAFYECQRDWSALQIISPNGAHQAAMKIGKKLLPKTIKYHITELTVSCARKLRMLSGAFGDKKAFEYYDEIVKQYTPVLNAEILSEEFTQRVRIHFVKAFSVPEGFNEMAMDYYLQLRALANQHDSFTLQFNMYRVGFFAFMSKFDYHTTLELCADGEQWLAKNPQFSQPFRLAELAMTKLGCYMHLRDYAKGIVQAETCLAYYPPGRNNWFYTIGYYFLMLMHAGEYREAHEVFHKAVDHTFFKQSNPERLEQFKIYEAYLHYVLVYKTDGHDLIEHEEQAKFEDLEFLKDVRIFSKDKRGPNVMVLIIQILFLLEKRDFNAIINRSEALRTYNSRYLKKDDDYRSNCFIKMLLIMEKKSFDYEDTRRLARKYYEKLKSSQANYQGTATSLEVIPYERLWEFVLHALKRSEMVVS